MAADYPTDGRASPGSVRDILGRMDDGRLRELSRTLSDEYDLISIETPESHLFAPASPRPSPAALRATAVCRDIAAIRAEP